MKREKLKIKKFLPTAILVFFFLSLAGQILAISCTSIPCTGPIVDCSQIDCNSLSGIPDVMGRLIGFGLSCIAVPLGTLILIIGGIWFLLAGGDPGKIEKGRNAIIAAIIALLIIFLAKVLLNAFLQSIGRSPVC